MDCDENLVSSIRSASRQQFQQDIKEHRHDNFAIRRRGIDEQQKVSNVCTPDEVKELVARMKHKPSKSLVHFKRIRQSMGQSQESVKAFLKADGALQLLVGHLTSSDVSLQIEAACCAANIGLWGGKASSSSAKATGHYLLTFINTNLPHVQEACTWAITNLYPECLKVIAVNDLLPCLTKALSSPHENVVEAVLDCLNRLIVTTPTVLELRQMSSLTKQAVLLTRMQSTESVQLLAWLFYFCSCSDHGSPILAPSGIVPWAVSCLYNASKNQINPYHRTVIPLVRLLANLCAYEESCARELLYHAHCLALLNGLLGYSFLCVRKETAWLIANVMNQESEDIQSLLVDMQVEHNLKQKLLPVLTIVGSSLKAPSMKTL